MRGCTRRRMSMMLRVICATSGSERVRVSQSGSPTRTTSPLPSRVAVSAGSASRGSSFLASASARSASGDVLAERHQQLGAARLGARP